MPGREGSGGFAGGRGGMHLVVAKRDARPVENWCSGPGALTRGSHGQLGFCSVEVSH